MTKQTVALLPFLTPHKAFESCSVFHPAGLPAKQSRKADAPFKESTDYTGYHSVKMAASFTHVIFATIPSVLTPAGATLKALLSTYVDSSNVLAEVECFDEEGPKTIMEQVERAFTVFDGYNSVTVVMPYQLINLTNPFDGEGEATFAYSHGGLNYDRKMIPEGVGIYCKDENLKDAVATSVGYYNELDEIVKGNYTKMLSCVEIMRGDFELHLATAGEDKYNLAKFLQKTLVGKRGVLVNPNGNAFI